MDDRQSDSKPEETKPEQQSPQDTTPGPVQPVAWKTDDTIKLARELIRRAFEQNRGREGQQTNELDVRDQLPISPNMPYAVNRASSNFTMLPKDAPPDGPRWLLSLEGLVPGHPLGIEVAGDVVLGTVRENAEAPDLDLSSYDAEEKGVSRRHAMLRPGKGSLYLIDMKSTNGTSVNGMTAGNGMAIELHHRDSVSLGALTFVVKILASPLDFERAAELRLK
jgi:hypothetical protein